jgi:RimJ/RimL family protein N-acetyltransferase
MSDADLLRIEMETLWGEDTYGRFERRPQVVLLATSAGSRAYLGEELPLDVARQLQGLARDTSVAQGPSQPPPGWDRYRELLGRLGAVEQTSGPSYLVEPETRHPSAATVVRSDRLWPALLRELRPSPGWEPDEWGDLLRGRLGPWAIMLEGRKLIAICHTPRASASGAEAGVWTHPGHRGNGHAATVTAAWASTPVGEGRRLFYSTSADNKSSQRVAERLALRPIGWIWTLRLT